MPKGFLHSSAILSSKEPTTTKNPKCDGCGLYKNCETPKMPVTGDGRMKTLVVAEAPGKKEDEHGTQLIGRAGQELRKHLRRIGIDLDKDCWKTNALICRPPDNRAPKPDEIKSCRPNLINTIKELEPEKIILLGKSAVESLIGSIWKKHLGAISRWVGWRIPCQTYNTWICPTYHSSYIVREQNEVLSLWFSKHLEKVFSLDGHPWKKIPDYKNEIEIILDPVPVVKIIHQMRDYIGLAAFDYETNMLKPDSKEAQAVCCSIAWGNEAGIARCIAFPIEGLAREGLRSFIRNPIPKVAANMKFEDRWTRKLFGHRVRCWKWDTMQAAHVLDNRSGITSLKFQSFIHLGFPPYDEHISPFLEGGTTTINQMLDEVDMEQLLLYCGLDSLLELKLALKQMELLGVETC